MTLRIAQSVIAALGFDFAAAVAAHRDALMAHRYSGDAAPTAHALVEQAVSRIRCAPEEQKPDSFMSDYVVIDDTPPEPVISDAERKAGLLASVRLAEQQASHAVIGPGQLRLLSLDAQQATVLPKELRTNAHDAVLASFATVSGRLFAIQYHAAKLEAEIDDLTPAQYDAWKPAPFPVT